MPQGAYRDDLEALRARCGDLEVATAELSRRLPRGLSFRLAPARLSELERLRAAAAVGASDARGLHDRIDALEHFEDALRALAEELPAIEADLVAIRPEPPAIALGRFPRFGMNRTIWRGLHRREAETARRMLYDALYDCEGMDPLHDSEGVTLRWLEEAHGFSWPTFRVAALAGTLRDRGVPIAIVCELEGTGLMLQHHYALATSVPRALAPLDETYVPERLDPLPESVRDAAAKLSVFDPPRIVIEDGAAFVAFAFEAHRHALRLARDILLALRTLPIPPLWGRMGEDES